MSTLSRKETIVKSRTEMLDLADGNKEQLFKDACSQFGGLDIARTLLLHESKLHNNINATDFLGKTMESDYDRAVKRAGTIMNRLEGRYRIWVNFRQQGEIRAQICQLYAQMTEWDIDFTRRGFSFPCESVDAKFEEIESS